MQIKYTSYSARKEDFSLIKSYVFLYLFIMYIIIFLLPKKTLKSIHARTLFVVGLLISFFVSQTKRKLRKHKRIRNTKTIFSQISWKVETPLNTLPRCRHSSLWRRNSWMTCIDLTWPIVHGNIREVRCSFNIFVLLGRK